MRVSVIVPTRGRRDALRRCLAALRAQDHGDFEILVSDDGSRDGSAAMVRAEFPEVRLVAAERSGGPAAARNRALRQAAGALLAFTDDDCVAPPDWLRRLEALHADPKVGAAGGLQVAEPADLYDRFEMARFPEWYGADPGAGPRATGVLETNNMAVRRAALDQVGVFDERFRTGEDPELSRRIARAGWTLLRDPGLRVRHERAHTLGSYLVARFHRGCGSVLTDLQEGTLALRRFVPVPGPASTRRHWRAYRRLFGGGAGELARFLGLSLLARAAEVAGRAYYGAARGRAVVRGRGSARERGARPGSGGA